MTLILDVSGTPLDISAYVQQKTDIYEEPVYTSGVAEGKSKVGTPIYDRLRTIYRFSVPLKPNVQSIYALIDAKCRMNKMSVTYTSYTQPTPRTLTGQCTFSRAQFVKTINRDGVEENVYAGPTITFEGYE